MIQHVLQGTFFLDIIDMVVHLYIFSWISLFMMSKLLNFAISTFAISNPSVKLLCDSMEKWYTKLISHIVETFLLPFARHLYINLPLPIGWNGQQEVHICASLTQMKEDHFVQNPVACTQRLNQQVYSWLVLVQFAFVIFAAVAYIKHLAFTKRFLFFQKSKSA